ncbi:toxin-antitoxin system YwqK family antitoxin [Saprospiraceae bacterium]|nr:toxin-antitoxin system YwqK family antitoxin [Saprospiraceae bacterium]
MKQTIFFLSLIALFISCSDLSKQEEISDYSKEIYYIDSEDLRQGYYVELSLNGDTISTANYKDGELEGTRVIYDSTGFVKTIENHKAGVFHGPIITYFANGKIQTKGNYTNNTLDSIFYAYYESGELKEKVTVHDNSENGPFEEYFESGQVHWKGSFINGPNEIGLLLEYDEKGVLIKKMDCGLYLGEYICQTIWDINKGDVSLEFEYD